MESAGHGRGLDRRGFLLLAGGLGLGLTGCATQSRPGATASPSPTPSGTASPTPTRSPTATDLLRPGSAAGTMQARPMQVDFAGRVVTTWGYNGTLPGPEIRLRRGERIKVLLDNRLPDPTTIHWHGIDLPNPMDGVPDVTQPAVRPGGAFLYEFTVPDAGSFMYHAHVGHQLDLGLYGPLIIEDPDEPGDYDREYTLMLDDWRDGLGVAADHEHDDEATADADADADAEPTAAPGRNAGPGMGARRYPLFVINGRPAADPQTLAVKRGERIRLRVMNIAADTGFRFAISGHRLTVTHTDGRPVTPVTVDTIRLGMGERYDVIVEAAEPGAWQMAAVPEGKVGFGRAVLRYTDSPGAVAPALDLRPAELDGRLLTYADLRYAGERTFGSGRPDRQYDLVLTTNRINGRRYPNVDPFPVSEGELVRFTMRNDSVLWHPMHLHGHSLRVQTTAGPGPVKDTVSVPSAGGTATFDFVASNPGDWMFHCHNHYHMDNGMARLVTYPGT
jgi:FtsP/CotA-like multicopper oxidase with cupredoxin domain